mmetsp:Transcript_1878/g.2899  ORF Transcript_1878/g.2899 Transcript_1878/m.2899 type:complete len:694 (+) Transcript_1878:146-2227(+)
MPDQEQYDYIVVGLGYAGAIVTARLAERAPDAKILAIEYGGPVQAATGGATQENVTIQMTAEMFLNAGAIVRQCDTQRYEPKMPLCMPDVPGNYNNVAFRPLSDGYYLQQQFPACFQGVGLGGNGIYNGALYQEPANWWWNDKIHNDIFVTSAHPNGTQTSDVMKPYFERVKKELKDAIKSSPSMDGVHYNHGLYDLVKPYLIDNQFDEVNPDIPELEEAGKRFFTVPTVNAHEGIRTGPSAWLQKFINSDGNVRPEFPNLKLMMYTEVLNVNLDDRNAVTGVKVKTPSSAKQGGLKKTKPVDEIIFNVKKGGKVILCCNTLPTNRILYRSGIGCEELRNSVMPGSTSSFKVNNEAIGTVIQEHITTSLGMKYTGVEKHQPNSVHFNPGDFAGNVHHLENYVKNRSGPFCQFGPVVASHFVANMGLIKDLPEHHKLPDDEVTTELFYNPFGIGPYPPPCNPNLNPFNGPGTFSIYVMLLRPEQRGLFRLEKDNDTAEWVELYMCNANQDWDPSPEQRDRLCLPDYREAANRDIGVMTASIMEVLKITADAPDIKLTLGPGDKQTIDEHYTCIVGNERIPIGKLDPENPEHVKGFVTYWGDDFCVNGERVPVTRLEENHYNCSAPLARNFDVFGNDLGERKDCYGVNPDTLEVRGTTGLCIADSSIFPKVIYCHPIGATMAVAEWASDIICPAS